MINLVTVNCKEVIKSLFDLNFGIKSSGTFFSIFNIEIIIISINYILLFFELTKHIECNEIFELVRKLIKFICTNNYYFNIKYGKESSRRFDPEV